MSYHKTKPIFKYIFASFFSTCSVAGPFGIEMGESIDELKTKINLVKEDDFKYYSQTAPKPHPDLVSYQFNTTPQTNICTIVARTADISTNAYGDALLSSFDDLSKGLTDKYGKPTEKINTIVPHSAFPEPEYFIMALTNGDREYKLVWKDKLPDNLYQIQLVANTRDMATGYVSIYYAFNNFKKCWEIITKEKNKNL